jgi:hypothetical protein
MVNWSLFFEISMKEILKCFKINKYKLTTSSLYWQKKWTLWVGLGLYVKIYLLGFGLTETGDKKARNWDNLSTKRDQTGCLP